MGRMLSSPCPRLPRICLRLDLFTRARSNMMEPTPLHLFIYFSNLALWPVKILWELLHPILTSAPSFPFSALGVTPFFALGECQEILQLEATQLVKIDHMLWLCWQGCGGGTLWNARMGFRHGIGQQQVAQTTCMVGQAVGMDGLVWCEWMAKLWNRPLSNPLGGMIIRLLDAYY